MFCMPLLLITIFSYALRDYMGGEYGTFDDAKLYYYVSDDADAKTSSFEYKLPVRKSKRVKPMA